MFKVRRGDPSSLPALRRPTRVLRGTLPRNTRGAESRRQRLWGGRRCAARRSSDVRRDLRDVRCSDTSPLPSHGRSACVLPRALPEGTLNSKQEREGAPRNGGAFLSVFPEDHGFSRGASFRSLVLSGDREDPVAIPGEALPVRPREIAVHGLVLVSGSRTGIPQEHGRRRKRVQKFEG